MMFRRECYGVLSPSSPWKLVRKLFAVQGAPRNSPGSKGCDLEPPTTGQGNLEVLMIRVASQKSPLGQ